MAARRYAKVVGLGFACVDHLMRWESLDRPVQGNRIVQYDMQGGGMTGTALVAASRLGAKAEFWGAVGCDTMGDLVLAELAKEGVETSRVVRVKSGQGPVVLVCVDSATGERHFYWSNGKSCPEPARPIGAATWLAGAGCLLVDGTHLRSAVRMAAAARRKRIPVVVDFGWVSDPMKELLAHVDYAVAAEHVAKGLDAGDDFALACRRLRKLGPAVAVITRGPRGVVALDGERWIERPAYEVQAVDTTGAGDTFHGAFAFGLVRGLPLEANLAFASATSALKCLRLGGRAGIPNLGEVLRFLKQREPGLWPQLRGLR